MKNTKYLYQPHKNGNWHVTLDVPLKLREKIGKKRLTRSLRTKHLSTANRTKFSVLAEFHAILDDARSSTLVTSKGTRDRALWYRDLISEAELDHDNNIELEHGEIITQKDLLLDQIEDEARKIEDKSGYQKASEFFDVASKRLTPILLPLEQWLASLDNVPRTIIEKRTSIKEFVGWLDKNKTPITIESCKRRVAAQYRDVYFKANNIHPKTANKKLSALRVYWEWLIDHEYASDNVWHGMSLKKPKNHLTNINDRQRAWTDDELKIILEKAPNETIHDAVLIAAYSGMRGEEIFQLKVKDICNDMFLITKGKTLSSARRIPVHSILKDIVSTRTENKSSETFLFDEVNSNRKDGKRFQLISQKFSRYITKINLREKRESIDKSSVNFHSLRHWFATKLTEQGVLQEQIGYLMGHKGKNLVSTVYSEGATDAQLREWVEKIPKIT